MPLWSQLLCSVQPYRNGQFYKGPTWLLENSWITSGMYLSPLMACSLFTDSLLFLILIVFCLNTITFLFCHIA